MFKAVSENFTNAILILRQNLFNYFMKFKSVTQSPIKKILSKTMVH